MSNEEKKGKVLRIVSEIIDGKVVQQTTGEARRVQAQSITTPPPAVPLKGKFDIAVGLRQTVKSAIQSSGKDKYQIIAEMGMLMNRGELDYNGPEKWSSLDKENELPAEYLPAFCSVTGSLEPLKYIAEQLGYILIEK